MARWSELPAPTRRIFATLLIGFLAMPVLIIGGLALIQQLGVIGLPLLSLLSGATS